MQRRPLHLLPATLLLAAASGCSDPEPSQQSLLTRAPDAVVEQRGELVARPEPQPWGEFGLEGWFRAGQERDGLPFVWTRKFGAALRLPALDQATRDLELVMWSPGGLEEPESVAIQLNGIGLRGSPVELTAEPQTFRFEVDAPVWRVGDNFLELDLLSRRRASDGVWKGMALSSVRFGENLSPSIEPGKAFRLEAATGLSYDVELLSDSELVLAGSAETEGFVQLVTSSVNPETGIASAAAEPIRFFAEGGRVSGAVPIACEPGHVARLELRWIPEEAGGPFQVEELAVREREGVARTPVIFVSIDTLSARNMSLYGYGRDTTPNLAAFAKEAVTFDHCVSNCSWTLPSFMSVMTGLLPYSHRLEPEEKKTGMRGEVWDLWYLAENRWTLAEALRASGYRTGGFVDNLWITEKCNFPQGFDVYDASAGELPHEDLDGGIRHVMPLALEWLDSLGDADPYFLFMHAFDVHGPYLPPKPWSGRFAPEDDGPVVPADVLVNSFGGIPSYISDGMTPGPDGPDELVTEPIRSAYDEGIAAMDAALGEFFDELRARGLFDEAVIVVTADHGESMDEHDYYFGHGVLYEQVVHIPLIIRLPGGEHGGRRVAGSVNLLDLYPTLIDYAGLSGERTYLHGRSLRPAIEGRSFPAAPTYSEGGLMLHSAVQYEGWKLIESLPAVQTRPATMLTNKHMPEAWLAENAPRILELGACRQEDLDELEERMGRGYIQEVANQLTGAFYELYYLPDDPNEERDLSAERPKDVLRLEKALRAAQDRRETARKNANAPRGERMEFDEDELEQLQALGYVQADEEESATEEDPHEE